jgi:hypothetical protein
LPDWLLERGIGEERLVRAVDGEIVEARIHLEDSPRAGTICPARLASARPQVLAESAGWTFLLPGGASGHSEGTAVFVEVTREPIPGGEPWKRPLARVVDSCAESAQVDAKPIAFPSPDDALESAGWSDLLDEARSGLIDFPGGQLRVSLTPAMTLIDVDGILLPDQLARAAATAAGRAIRRHRVGGSIGIDFPTVEGKALRTALGEAIDAGLEKPFERTAVNGFGFMQIVRPRRGPSLFELASDRAAFEARALLRRAARLVGPVTLTAHPTVIAELKPQWVQTLAAQVGGNVDLRAEPSMPISAGHAQ